MAASTPYIGPVNARSAPAAASRRPRKKRTKKRAGSFPLSGPPPPIGHPIRHPMRHPLRRRGLTAGLRPVRPSDSAGPGCPPCCPAMPPRCRGTLPLGQETGKFPIEIVFAHSRRSCFQRFQRVSPAQCKKRRKKDRSVHFKKPSDFKDLGCLILNTHSKIGGVPASAAARSATRARRSGSSSASNQGLRATQPRVRQLGCGVGR